MDNHPGATTWTRGWAPPNPQWTSWDLMTSTLRVRGLLGSTLQSTRTSDWRTWWPTCKRVEPTAPVAPTLLRFRSLLLKTMSQAPRWDQTWRTGSSSRKFSRMEVDTLTGGGHRWDRPLAPLVNDIIDYTRCSLYNYYTTTVLSTVITIKMYAGIHIYLFVVYRQNSQCVLSLLVSSYYNYICLYRSFVYCIMYLSLSVVLQ